MSTNGNYASEGSGSLSKKDMDGVFQEMLVRLFREEECAPVERMISHVRECRAMMWSAPEATSPSSRHAKESPSSSSEEIVVSVFHKNPEDDNYLNTFLDIGQLFTQISMQCVLHRPEDPLDFVMQKLNVVKEMSSPKSLPKNSSHESSLLRQVENKPLAQAQATSPRIPSQNHHLRRNSVSAECGNDNYQILMNEAGILESQHDENGVRRLNSDDVPLPVVPKSETQRTMIKAALLSNILFKGLEEDLIRTVVDAVDVEKHSTGSVVIRQGDTGNKFYIVGEGEVEVVLSDGPNKPPRAVRHYGPLQGFGELALMYNAPRAASVTCIVPTTLWTLDRLTFRTALGVLRKRESQSAPTSYLSTVPLLQQLSTDQHLDLEAMTMRVMFNSGDTIIQQGDDGDHFFILIEGQATVSIFNEVWFPICSYNAGDTFGELALLTGDSRTASVHATSEAACLVVDAECFAQFIAPYVDFRHHTQNYQYF